MEKVVAVFNSFAESDEADKKYYHSLTPEQRVDILLDLIQRGQPDETPARFERVCRVVKLGES